jgi:iron(III) transport system permease protein
LSTGSNSPRPPYGAFARRKALGWAAAIVALVIAMPLLAVVARALLGDPGVRGGGSALGSASSNTPINDQIDSAANLAHLVSTVLPGFILNTFGLAAGVLLVVLIAGVGSAWLIAAYDFPGRSWLARLLVLPLAMPGFVMAYAYTDFFDASGWLQSALRQLTGLKIGEYWFPEIRSVPGAALMLGLALFPYVYMLARPAFAERSASLSDAARTLGMKPRKIWWKVTLPVARPAIVAGCALVLMETLADFGTVSYFAVDSLAAGIYRAWQGLGDQTTAARLSLVLLAIVGLLLWLEKAQRGRMASHERQVQPAPRIALRRKRAIAAALFCFVWVFLGFLLPVGLLFKGLISQWQAGELTQGLKFVTWSINSGLLAIAGTLIIVPSALLVAYACRLNSKAWVRAVALFATSGYAVPGLVLAVGLLLIARQLDGLGLSWVRATIILVLLAYLARFFAVAFQGLQAGMQRIAPTMDDSARSLGASPAEVFTKIHWPMLKPSIGAATLLVFVDCLKELPATLVLRPFNFDTLAVVAYQYASDERLAAAAAPALGLVLIGLIPTIWLARGQK